MTTPIRKQSSDYICAYILIYDIYIYKHITYIYICTYIVKIVYLPFKYANNKIKDINAVTVKRINISITIFI